MNVLITGVAGQTGSYLAEYIISNHPDWVVHGTVRYRSDLSNVQHLITTKKLIIHDCELRDAINVHKVISKVKPDKIFHLAATSFVRSSWDQPADIITNNVICQINLFEAVLSLKLDPVIHCAGSSEQYGLVHEYETPIHESNPLRPISPYAVSKCAQEHLAYQYWQSHKLRTVFTRTFNHTSPRRTDAFVESSFAKQVAMIELGLQEPVIKHGNLDSVRDYTDARDIAEAYWLASDKLPYATPFNVSHGTSHPIKDVLDLYIANSNFNGTITTMVDPDRLRPSDVVLLHGDSTAFRDITGWTPKYSFDQTMLDLLNAWRTKLAKYNV